MACDRERWFTNRTHRCMRRDCAQKSRRLFSACQYEHTFEMVINVSLNLQDVRLYTLEGVRQAPQYVNEVGSHYTYLYL
jgi:hypothetical protein